MSPLPGCESEAAANDGSTVRIRATHSSIWQPSALAAYQEAERDRFRLVANFGEAALLLSVEWDLRPLGPKPGVRQVHLQSTLKESSQ